MTNPFADIKLAPQINQALTEAGMGSMREVQQQVIPVALEGEDLLVSAPTGSGKTLAFVIPILHRLHGSRRRSGVSPRALIVTPTRELGQQIEKVIAQINTHTHIPCTLLVGGVPYGMHVRALEEDLDIIVATPGRLLELTKANLLDLEDVEILVIDEADRLLDMGFIKPLLEIGEQISPIRQTLMFSATLEAGKVERLAATLINEDVKSIALQSPRKVADHVTHTIFQIDNDQHKEYLLKALISQREVKRALVFVETRNQVAHWVDIIRHLGIRCDGLHGDLPQKERTLRIKRMRRGRTKVLVTTDIAARGIDLPVLSHVVNLNLPKKADGYVHRAGRAGREGNSASAWSLVDGRDWPMVGRIERYLGEPLVRQRFPGLGATRPEPEEEKSPSKRDKKEKKEKMRGAEKKGKEKKRAKRRAKSRVTATSKSVKKVEPKS